MYCKFQNKYKNALVQVMVENMIKISMTWRSHTYFYFLQKTIACKNFETLQLGAWGNFAKKMFEKCVNTMGYRKCTWGVMGSPLSLENTIMLLQFWDTWQYWKVKSKWTSENTHPRVKNPKALWVQKANGIWIILEGTKLHYQRFK